MLRSLAILSVCIIQSSAQELEMPSVMNFEVPQVPNNILITQEPGVGVVNIGDATNQKLTYLGNFKLTTDTGIELNAKNAEFDLKTGDIILRNNISIFNQGVLQKGDSAIYRSKTNTIETSGLRISSQPVLMEAGSFVTAQNDKGDTYYIGKDASITTHDVKKPNYWVKAEKIEVYPDEKILFKNLKLYIRDTPVIWLPYFYQSLDAELGYHFTAGAQSNWGGYILNDYGTFIQGNADSFLTDNGKPWLFAKYALDLRSRRGVGTGVTLQDKRLLGVNKNLTGLELYYTNDLSPQTERSGLDRNSLNEDRFKIALQHRQNIPSKINSNTFFDFNLTYLSDENYLEDFELGTYTTDPEPVNRISFIHQTPQLLTGITSQLRLNHFYDTTTSSPEIFLDYVKSPVLDTPILYEGSLNTGIYKELLGHDYRDSLRSELDDITTSTTRAEEIQNELDDKGYGRFHTWHEFSLPISPMRGLSIVPHIGSGYSHYWDNRNQIENFDRSLLHAGIDLSLTFSKKYNNVYSSTWGIDSLLHVIKPYVTYSKLSAEEVPTGFQPIQDLTGTTEIRSLKIGRLSNLDEISDWSIYRLGVRNSLITKRDGGSHQWLSLNSYIDMYDEDPEFDRNFSNLYNDITWSPLPWVEFDLRTQFPISDNRDGFSEYALASRFMLNRSTEFSLGYRYLNSHPTLEDTSNINLRSYTKINEQWGVGARHVWQMDDGVLELQEYSLHKDLGSWAASLAVSKTDNRIQEEYAIGFSFTLKDLPTVSLPLSYDPN